MSYNILIGGAAGQGMDTLASLLEKILKRKGYEIFTIRDYMSRVRGGHNFIQVRFGTGKLVSHWGILDGIIAINAETIELHAGRLHKNSFIICDREIEIENSIGKLDINSETLLRLPLKDTAKSSGNPRAFGSVALGAVLRLFDIDLEQVEDALSHVFKDENVTVQNLQALKEGYRLVQPKYKAAVPYADRSILINGNQAIALGALAAGCRFYSAYPMTPSTSIMDYLAEKMGKGRIVVEQAEDEIAAINMAIGASFAGARAMTGTSGGGFSLMVEALGLSAMTEVPLVVAEIQRPGPTTGFPTRTEQSDLKFVISEIGRAHV